MTQTNSQYDTGIGVGDEVRVFAEEFEPTYQYGVVVETYGSTLDVEFYDPPKERTDQTCIGVDRGQAFPLETTEDDREQLLCDDKTAGDQISYEMGTEVFDFRCNQRGVVVECLSDKVYVAYPSTEPDPDATPREQRANAGPSLILVPKWLVVSCDASLAELEAKIAVFSDVADV